MKKIIYLVLICTMCFTTVCYAEPAFKDIKGAKYENAVNKLTTFKVINGYEDNTFRPNEKVTRAQLAKIIITSMGKANGLEDAKKKFLSFPDVLSGHWGYGYIKIASDEKIINGYADGKFKPEGFVTYAEATAMVIRALDFEDAVKQSTLTWPSNYMSYADEKLDLFESMGEFKANDLITRSNMAILVWNALRTGMSDIVATNQNGVVYGPGSTPMITKFLSYIYIYDAEFIDVEFSDDLRTATVTLKEEDKKAKEFEFAAEDVLNMYGKKVTLLYDNESKKMIELNAETDLNVIESEITNITSRKIYVASKSKGYNLPDDDNILYYGISKLSEAVNAILLVDGSDVEYMVVTGASDVQVGIIVDEDAVVGDPDDDDYGVKVRKLGESKGGTAYMVNEEDDESGDNWPEEDKVYLYYIDADDLFTIITEIDESDKVEIDGIYKKYIETEDGDEYEFDDEDDYTVIFVGKSKLTEGKLSDVDEKSDMINVYEYNAHLYFFIYEGLVEDDVDDDILDALDDLDDLLDDVKDLNEEEYTQESFAYLMEEVEYAYTLDYDSSLSKIKRAIKNIEDAIDDLNDNLSRKEEKIVAAKKDLRALVKEAKEEYLDNEDDYTGSSIGDLEDVYDDAMDLLTWTDATFEMIDDMYEDLKGAIGDLKED